MTGSHVMNKKNSSSFRDPSGYLFYRNGTLYRNVDTSYRDHYEKLIRSDLYDSLVKKNLLIRHKEVDDKNLYKQGTYKVLKPDFIPFISYPYEWCFSQLKDAALLTLEIQKYALAHGMTLKDASAYNIQFYKGKPILIDSLSFEVYDDGSPWVAYRQFCQHFFAPLSLMSIVDVRMGQLLQAFIDGVPLDLCSQILPKSTYTRLSLLLHIHLHSKGQKKFSGKNLSAKKRAISKDSQLALLESLKNGINKMKLRPKKSEWENYYEIKNYSDESFQQKGEIVSQWIKKLRPKEVWDLGANTGTFSRKASSEGIFTASFDIDFFALEKSYKEMRSKKEENLLPLFLDLTNPSPSLGWAHRERNSLLDRGPADMVLALALIHHLALSNNVPFDLIARFFRDAGKSLIVEFIHKSDSYVQKLLSTRKDIFDNYDKNSFEKSFSDFFSIEESVKIKDSERYLYLMKRHE